MKELKCPACGGIIEYDECVDTMFHNNTYFDTVIGKCNRCGQTYLWEEVFKFEKRTDLRKIEEN